ncbi:Mn/Zn ABC transporter extracellular binding protein [Gracilibacillus halophilus YIM-C55.5]|uniref:Mn/Zn ABC transporter extracellular binding protein n=1 Tax=Gracilibacillus halophilus YIM-C55.5 TaxID=1308866 RepID=N4WL34_9BACI|nr:Mn/Zn ABC transporter extracellular binding protein [Gracilibacillus halophilus YIM-C55.5]
MVKNILGVFALLILIFMMVACGNESTNHNGDGNNTQNSNEELKIFTTVYPIQYFTERVAGDEASVESILPAGSNPHNYEPTSEEIVKIAESDAFIYNGTGLEPFAKQISDSIQSEDVKITEAAKGIELKDHVHSHEEGDEREHEEGESSDHNHGDSDPHVWLDPIRSIDLAENIKDALIELRPDQEEAFNKNFEQLKGELENLDQEFHTQIESLPENKIIVSHEAYGYWEQSYGIEQIALSGLSPTNEPSQKEIQNIIDTAETHGLNYVFFEQNVTPKVADVVRKEIDAETLRIHNLSVLTEEDINNDEDYFSLMERNLEVLTEGLSESASVSDDSSETTEESNNSEHDHEHSHSHE